MAKLISIVVLLVLIFGGIMLFKNQSTAPAEIDVTTEASEDTQVSEEASEVKEFVVTTDNFSFAPSTMTVNVGDTVRIVVKNDFGMHDLVIDEFAGAKTSILSAGQEEVITFVADKAGSFEYYCSVGTHRQMGMVGTLTVL